MRKQNTSFVIIPTVTTEYYALFVMQNLTNRRLSTKIITAKMQIIPKEQNDPDLKKSQIAFSKKRL